MFKNLFNINNKKRNEISFKQGLDLTGLPVVTFYQNNKKINFILDTGANYSIINESVIDSLEYAIGDQNSTIYGMEGNIQQTKTCFIELSYKNQNFNDEFMICNLDAAFKKIRKDSGVIVHGILGSEFFKKYEYILDFKELIAYSQK